MNYEILTDGTVHGDGQNIGKVEFRIGFLDGDWYFEPKRESIWALSLGDIVKRLLPQRYVPLTLMQKITDWVKQKKFNDHLHHGRCPDCEKEGTLLKGPGAPGCQNVMCEECQNEFNIIGLPMACRRIRWSGPETRW